MAYFTSELFLSEIFFPGHKVVTKPQVNVTIHYDITTRVVENITVHIGNGVAAKLNWVKFNKWIEQAAARALESTKPVPYIDNEPALENSFSDNLLSDLHDNAISKL